MQTPRDARRGFTLVELLVVIAIIGILVGLLLPAVQNAREAGRRTQCTNNLKNLALAAQQHEVQYKKMPNGGWGSKWIGDPDAGNTEKQNGGWVYNILPFIELTALHDDGTGVTPVTNKDPINAKRVSRVISLLMCPSRRPGATFQISSSRQPYRTSQLTTVGRSDYAANAGVRYTGTNLIGDPLGCDLPESAYPDEGDYDPTNKAYTTFNTWPDVRWTGVIYQRTGVPQGAIKDGTTYTYLFGEKYVDVDHYDTGAYSADNDTMFSGFGNDNYRTTYVAPSPSNGPLDPEAPADTAAFPPLRNDSRSSVPGDCSCSFGGPHSGIVIFAFCDGQVRSISTSIDPFTHRFLGERADREVLDDKYLP